MNCKDCPHIIGDTYQRDCCFPDCVGGWEKAYEDLAEENRQLKESQRWIPVSDRLPEIGEAVICAKYFEKQKEWWNSCCIYREYGFPFASFEGDAVTHWMPLPQPPTSE